MGAVLRSVAAVVCACAIVGAASDAVADDENVDDLFRRGVALRREHRNEEALALFRTILARAPTPAARAQVAMAEQALGRWIVAERDLDAALAVGDDAWIAKNRAALESARTVVEGHLAWMTVNVDVPSAAIAVAGDPVANGVEARVVAGDVVLDVRADGRIPAHRLVAVAPADHAVVAIALEPVPSTEVVPVPQVARPTAPPPHLGSPPPAVAGPIALGAVGIVALAAGAYFGVRTIDFKSERNGACTNGCIPAALTYDADARSSATASTVAFALGGGFLATGVVWWLIDRGHTDATRPSVEVAPLVGVGGGGFVVRGAL